MSPLPGQGKFSIWSPKKQFLMHILGKDLLEYDFLQIPRGQDDNYELYYKHAVSDVHSS